MIKSISARSWILSPALDLGGFTASNPLSPSTGTFMKMLKAVGISSEPMPYGSRASTRLPKQPRWTGLSG